MGLSTLVFLTLLCLLSVVCVGAEECVYVAAGKSEVVLHHEYLASQLFHGEQFHVRWKHNSGILYDSRSAPAKRGRITAEFNLLLENLRVEDAGTYEVTIYSEKGVLLNSATTHLCVITAVSKPHVTRTCGGASVSLRCHVGAGAGDANASVSWRRNGKAVPDAAGASLAVGAAELRPGDRYACLARNGGSEETSDEVNPAECTDASSSPAGLLFGVNLWVMVGILAGGGGLFFILLIITSVCLCRSCRQHKERLDEERELRLAPLTKPSRQASLHHQRPPPRSQQGRARPQNRAPIQATQNCRPQAQTRPPMQPPAVAQPQPMPRRTAPRTNRS